MFVDVGESFWLIPRTEFDPPSELLNDPPPCLVSPSFRQPNICTFVFAKTGLGVTHVSGPALIQADLSQARAASILSRSKKRMAAVVNGQRKKPISFSHVLSPTIATRFMSAKCL